MKKLVLNNIDIYSIKSRFERSCFNYVKDLTSLGENEEVKKYKYGFKTDGIDISLHEKGGGYTYLKIKIESCDENKKELKMEPALSYIGIYLSIIFSIQICLAFFLVHIISFTVFLYLFIVVCLLTLSSYVYNTKKQMDFVYELFQDKIIES